MSRPRRGRPARRTLLLVPAWPDQLPASELDRLASEGIRARTDYVALAGVLDAEVMDWDYLQRRATRPARAVARRAGPVPAQVLEAWLQRNRYAQVVAKADRIGLPLALLHKLTRARRDIVLLSSWASRPKKAVFLHPLGAHSHLKAFVCSSSVQNRIAEEKLGVPHAKVHFARQPIDERFWRPDGRTPENVIASVGWEVRDYPTLLAAVSGVDVRIELAVGSIVVKDGDISAQLAPVLDPLRASAPGQMQVHEQLDHAALRELYARARFVVVPLQDVDFDAGSTVIAEAMAMGKAVIVTRTQGQRELVVEGETGLYVPPGDPAALRQAIESLLNDPAAAERMGRAGRARVEAHMTLDRWVDEIRAVAEA